MPFASQQQSKFIHAKANEGVAWAQKFVADAPHTKGSVKRLPKRVGPKKRIKRITRSS